MADIGPAPGGPFVRAPINSPNHDFEGQNILFADGSVDFRATPLSGVDQDHIYRTRSGSIFDSQNDPSDAILLPIQQ
jgi:prepilin-type processing-associated H-X9-DG protein